MVQRSLTAKSEALYLAAGVALSGVGIGTTAGDYRGTIGNWEAEVGLVGTTEVLAKAWTREKFQLAGLFAAEDMPYPILNTIQETEPPAMQYKPQNNTGASLIRLVEFWSTIEIDDAGVKAMVDLIAPRIPTTEGNANGSKPFPMQDEQAIYGRVRTYAGDVSLDPNLGFSRLLSTSYFGKGYPIASPNLYYVRAVLFYATVNNFNSGSWFCDLPAANDIMEVDLRKPKSDVDWVASVTRAAKNP